MSKQSFLLPKLMPRDRQICHIVDALEDLPISEGYRVEIHEHRATRSDLQNRTIWWVYDKILKLGGEMMGGWDREDLHEFFLIAHFGSITKTIFGRKRLVPNRRSSRLSKMEFAEYMDSIYQFMRKQGVELPLPDPDMATFELRTKRAA